MSDSVDKNQVRWMSRKIRPYGEKEQNYSSRVRGSERNYKTGSGRYGCLKMSLETWNNIRRKQKKVARRKAKEEIKEELTT